MVESMELKNFRGFKDLKLDDIQPLTVLSGKNNAGKSSILEGLFLYFDHAAPDSFAKINNFRKMPLSGETTAFWEPAFYNLDVKNGLRISLKLDGTQTDLSYMMDTSFVPTDIADTPQDLFNQFVSSAKNSYTLKFKYMFGPYQEDGHFVAGPSGVLRNIETTEPGNHIKEMPFTQFISPMAVRNDTIVAEWIGKLELDGKKEQIIQALQILDPAVSDISIIPKGGQIQLYVKLGSKLLPLGLAGDGLNRLLFIILSIVANPDSVILIDEIDSGLHYSMYTALWETIARTAREGRCQVIASTHSYECIVGAVEGIRKAGRAQDFCYYRISRDGQNTLAHRYSGELLDSAISMNMEVR